MPTKVDVKCFSQHIFDFLNLFFNVFSTTAAPRITAIFWRTHFSATAAKTIRSAGSGSAVTPENSGNFLSTKTAKKISTIFRAKKL